MRIIDYLFDDMYMHTSSEYIFENTFENILKEKLSKDWMIRKDRLFLYLSQALYHPKAGWKIHVSTSVDNAEIILQKVIRIIDKEKCSFKVYGDKNILALSSQKFFPRTESGKFITIYPPTKRKALDLLEELYREIGHYKGPHILTDERYKDSECLFYRYGSFDGQYVFSEVGKKIPVYYDCIGNMVHDERSIPYKGPKLKYPNAYPMKKSRLLEKYQVLKCVHMSNSGGVYLAKDKKGNECIVKEARDYTVQSAKDPDMDAVKLLENEYQSLKEFSKDKICPIPIEILHDYENCYLIEEYLHGQTLFEFSRINNPIYHAKASIQDYVLYYQKINEYLKKLLCNLQAIHLKEYTFTDITANNIIITDDGLKLIDFESCTKNEYVMVSSKPLKDMNTLNSSLLQLFYSLIIKHEDALWIDCDIVDKTIEFLQDKYQLDLKYHSFLKGLKDNKSIDELISLIPQFPEKISFHKVYNETTIRLQEEIKGAILKNLKKNLIDLSLNCEEDGRYSYAYGLLGIKEYQPKAEMLLSIGKEMFGNIPIGLMHGSCGIAWKLIEMNALEEAKEIMRDIHHNTLFCNSYDLENGLAGYALCLEFYLSKRFDEELIENLEECMHFLREIYARNNNFLGINNVISFGYLNGKTGIAIVCLYASILLNDSSYLELGIHLIQDECAFLETMKDNDGLYLPYSSKDHRKSPYFSRGTGGLIAVACRFNAVLNKDITGGKLKEMIKTLDVTASINAGQFQGISGIGETYLDLYMFTKKKEYLLDAKRILKTLGIYTLKTKDGYQIPSDLFQRISYDYASGMSGISDFLERCDKPQLTRRFFIDELLGEKFYDVIN